VAAVIISLNGKLVVDQIRDWSEAAGDHGWVVYATVGPAAIALLGLLAWMTFRPEREITGFPVTEAAKTSADFIADAAHAMAARRIRRIGVALGAEPQDVPMLAEAVSLARSHKAELLLMHVVEGVGGQYHGSRADDVERRADELYVEELAARLRRDLDGDVGSVHCVLGYGDVRRELVRLASERGVDLLVMGGHGHRVIGDLLRGTTIDAVRHRLMVPVLAVR
jgi:manganese transport protein